MKIRTNTELGVQTIGDFLLSAGSVFVIIFISLLIILSLASLIALLPIFTTSVGMALVITIAVIMFVFDGFEDES